MSIDLVFSDANLTETSLVDLYGNPYINISTRYPNYALGPITGIDKLREVLPQKTLSEIEVNRRLYTSNHRNWVGFVEWKTLDTPALFRHDLFSEETNRRGLLVRSFMKRKERKFIGGSDKKEQTFRGDDNIWYRWKIDKCFGSILTRRDDNKEVARVRRQRVSEGIFQDDLHTTIHIKNPEEVTLDFTMLLMTYLWIDHPRLEEELGKEEWAPKREERFLPGPDFFYPDQEGGICEAGRFVDR